MSSFVFANVFLANKKDPIELVFDNVDHYIQFQGIVLGKFPYQITDARYENRWVYIDPRDVISVTPLALTGDLHSVDVTLNSGQEINFIAQGNDCAIQTYQALTDKMVCKAALPITPTLTAVINLPRKALLSHSKGDLYISSVVMTPLQQ